MEMNHQQFSVPLSRLTRDEAVNVRRVDQTDIASMKASILASGIIQPLAVRPPAAEDVDLGGQTYRVFAGGRRLRALNELASEGSIPQDYAVPVIVRTEGDLAAQEMSLAENLIRKPMEPVQEFRAFKELADGGMSIAEIALRFGQTERFVKGRLALGHLHPEILEAFAKDEIRFDAATAYTLNPDQEAQVAYFREAEDWRRGNSSYIRRAMVGEAIRADSEIAKFIGEDRYLDAGGAVAEDLFGKDTMWTSPEIIAKLKVLRLSEARADALAEGWSFYEPIEEFGVESYRIRTLHPEGTDLSPEDTARMDELAAYLETIEDPDDLDEEAFEEYEKRQTEYDSFEGAGRSFTPEQKAKAGIVYDPERMQFWVGAIRPGAEIDSGSRKSGAPDKPAKDPLALTQPLKDMIGETATKALAAAVVAEPHKALALVAAMLEIGDVGALGVGRPSRIKLERYDYGSAKAIDVEKGGVKKRFDRFAKMSGDDLAAVIASLAAGTVDLSEKWFYKDFTGEEVRASTRQQFLEAFGAKPIEAFDPDAYFAACTKPMIDAAMKEMTGFSATKPRKADMAKEAAEAARKTGWLPKELRLKGFKLKKS